ncbi:hypothetical protein [Chondromyces crocatus]|uniref:Lipoprotein n=1 Tax=Chondromyces crocatus TaxID=52 RepID=A0A0K1EEZ1_CHOCO|nr:hypothetical protein [Chondromyces crocatus]AKT39436.1 uncharacterized protein CMC5_035830 [Chondromyces crocatus]
MQRVTRSGIALLLSLGACGGNDDDGDRSIRPEMHPSWRRARVVIADADAPRLSLIDVELSELVGEVPLARPASALTVSSSGEHVLVAHGGSAEVVYAGVALLDHSEGATDADAPHIHVYKFPPKRIDYPLDGVGQPRITAHEDRFGLLFPGDDTEPARAGSALSFAEATLYEEPPSPPERLTLPSPYAGVAFPLSGRVLIAGPEGVTAHTPQGAATTLADTCGASPALAWAAGHAVLACDTALLVIQRSGSDLTTTAIPYADGAARPATLQGHPDRPIVLAHHGEAALTRYDLADLTGAAPLPTRLSLPAEPCDFGLEPGYGKTVTVLAQDGTIYQLDADDGSTLAQRDLLAPFACTDLVRPRLAQTPARAYVSDPRQREVHELWLDHALERLNQWPVQGTPSLLVVAGIDEETRNLGDLTDVSR